MPRTERELELLADFASLASARRFVEEMAAAAGLPSGERYALAMACSEAVANAIEHGSAPGDRVVVRAAVEGDSLAVYVHDQGKFMPRVSRRGEFPERGRGLEFMSEMMDEVQIDPARDGTRVRLGKLLPGR